MHIFVFDTRDLTEALFEARLTICCRAGIIWIISSKSEANPKQFPDFSPRLGEIRAQTLIVWGRNDRFVPMDAGLRLLAGINGSELHLYRDCGHLGAVGTCRQFQPAGAGFSGAQIRSRHDNIISRTAGATVCETPKPRAGH